MLWILKMLYIYVWTFSNLWHMVQIPPKISQFQALVKSNPFCSNHTTMQKHPMMNMQQFRLVTLPTKVITCRQVKAMVSNSSTNN
jgi:hypothetical protein